jgi:hypothetical protein
VISIAGEQQLCQLIQSLDTENLAAIKLNFCICHSHPGLLHQNRPFHVMLMNFVMLKFFWANISRCRKIGFSRKPCDSVKILSATED